MANLAACDGSSSSSGAGPANSGPISTGTIEPLPIAGLSFSTASIDGVTNDAGEFSFREGERVAFRLGDIDLGDVEASAIVTLPELRNATDLTSVGEIIDAFENRSPFLEAANLIRLLSSLDEDFDPSNGIQLSNETTDALDGSAIDFQESPRVFPYQSTVFRTLEALGRQMMPLDRSLAFYYQAAGITLTDRDVPLSRWTSRTNSVVASDPSTLSLPSFERSYNAVGDILEEVFSFSGGQASAQVTTYSYTAVGLQSVRENSVDGQTVSVTESTYNAAGDVIANVFTQTSSMTTSLREIVRNDRGLAIQEFSQGGGGSLSDSSSQREFDEQDRLLRSETDFGNDGLIDWSTARRYDQLGRLIEETTENRISTAVPVGGPLPQLGRSAIDTFDPTSPFAPFLAFAGGVVPEPGLQTTTSVTRFRWDENGFLNARETDQDNDGSIDLIFAYEYSDERLVRYSQDADGDGSPEQQVDYVYDGEGMLVRVTDTQQQGGVTPRVVRDISYNDRGQRVRIAVQADPNSREGDSEQRFDYDAEGRLTVSETICSERCIFSAGAVQLTETTVWEVSHRLTDSQAFLRYWNDG